MHRGLENLANTEQRPNRNRPTCFDLLPVSGRETMRNHVLLTEPFALAQPSNPLPEPPEELPLIYHAEICSITRAEMPRAD